MNMKKIYMITLSLFMFYGCSSSDPNEDTMISLKDYNSYYSEILSSSEE